MTCTSCKYQWCWLCEGMYSYNHYSQGQCNGHQFTKANYISEVKTIPEKKYNNFDYLNRRRDNNYFLNNNRFNYNNNRFNNNNNRFNYNLNNNNRVQNQIQPRTIIRKKKTNDYFQDDEEQTNCCFSLPSIFRCCLHKINYTEEDIDGHERLRALAIWFFGYLLFFAYQVFNTYIDYTFGSEVTEKFYKKIGYAMALLFFICYQIQFTIIITPFIIICMCYPFFVYKIKMFFSIGKALYFPENN